MQHDKIAIKSKNIYKNPVDDPIEGIILISDGKIEEIIDFNCDIQKISHYKLLNYEDSYIFPGLIDLNVNLCSNFEPEWSNVSETTKMALIGGITTIIDNPLMNNYYNKELNEEKAIDERIKKIKLDTFTDCGMLANLGNHNFKNFDEILHRNDILGFKIYFSPCLQNTMPFLKKDRLIKVRKIAESLKRKVFFSISSESANDRDLFMSSPCRSWNIGKNIIKKKFYLLD